MKIIVNTDGGCKFNSKGKPAEASAAFIAYTEDGRYLASQAEVLIGTNNVAEYRGVGLAAFSLPIILMKCKGLVPPFEIEFRCDSMLVVHQMNRKWKTKDADMLRLSEACRKMLDSIGWPYYFTWVPRTENKEADYLCNLALDGKVKKDMFTALPCHNKDAKATTGQLFRLNGELATPRPMRADTEGYALCNGCDERVIACSCPPLEEEMDGVLLGVQQPGERSSRANA